MSYTPFNAPILAPLLGDTELAACFSISAEIAAIRQFEIALAKAEADCGLIDQGAAQEIADHLANFEPDVRGLGKTTHRDGTLIPGLVAEMRRGLSQQTAAVLHFGTTSQDVTDTSMMMRMRDCVAILSSRLSAIIEALDALANTHGDRELMARTRMQQALPICLTDKINNWRDPLNALVEDVPGTFPLQLGGPNGRLDKLGDKADQVAELLAEALGLTAPKRHWQTNRMVVADLANWLSKLTGALGKMGQDIALMAQNEVAEVKLAGGGTSSAMPHKSNPVLAESLVTLARFNATQVAGFHQALVHENERSGAAWMLEWMLLPSIVVATGAATRNAADLLSSLRFTG